ncbi:c-type cytochrome [Novosphingobium sp.]|uniref:c-type cytochrome n=1 Tax=Novosphingobium sp. TaxID=1874826 RepID=UPI0025FDADB7|nr:c-type cytochrome [Novosphingobium sp.]
MKPGRLALAMSLPLSLALAASAVVRADEAAIPGVRDAYQARTDYQLKCQGCHRPDGSGDARSNPPMRGIVARFENTGNKRGHGSAGSTGLKMGQSC